MCCYEVILVVYRNTVIVTDNDKYEACMSGDRTHRLKFVIWYDLSGKINENDGDVQ